MTVFTSDECQYLRQCIRWFKENYIPEKYQLVYNRLTIVSGVKELEQLRAGTEHLSDLFHQGPVGEQEVIPSLIPCLKRALITYRLYEANLSDSMRVLTNNAEVIQKLDDRVKPFDDLLKDPRLATVSPISMPRPVDLLSIQELEQNPHLRSLAKREYDEKFHILQAPKLFLEDLRYYRRVCEERGTSVIAAYLDIDDFKRLNTRYGEVEVDRRVLPRFMHVLEAHVFQHGFAYRYGGDEYVVLLPNLSLDLAGYFLNAMRLRVSELRYSGIAETTTVSMGFCCVEPDCLLTDREIERRANDAKNFAKEQGKNRIATYKTSSFETDQLEIVSPLTGTS